MRVDVVPCQGQHSQPLALALWEKPRPLATRDRDAFQTLDKPFDNLVTVEEPLEWNTKLRLTKHWGLDDSAWIIRHFRATRHSVLNSVRKVIGLGIATSPEGQNKGHYLILDDFKEIHENSMLIHHGEMMAIILHEFVPSTEVSEHVRTLGDFFRYGNTILCSYSRESRMALFGHMFYRDNLTVDRSVPFHSPDGCLFTKPFFFPHDA